MNKPGWTNRDEDGAAFQTTAWSNILAAQTDDTERYRSAMSELLARYWRPVYAHIRGKGYSNELAKDRTQDFFCKMLADGGAVQTADPAKGSFRAYLRQAVDWHLSDEYDRDTAKKRAPDARIVALDAMGGDGIPVPAPTCAPEDIFDYEWASVLLTEALAEVKAWYYDNDKEAYWHLFEERVVKLILDNAAPAPLPDLCAKHGIKDEATASAMITTVKRRYRAILKLRVRELVQSDKEVDQEIAELMTALSRGHARS